MKRPESAAALIIGNELLTGKIAEANLQVLAKTLCANGIRLMRAVMVLDDVEVIAQEVRSLASSYDVVFTSGGVGPTHDDLTVDGVAAAFGVEPVPSPEIEQMLRGYYQERITEGHLRMARVPDGARLITTAEMPWPTVVMHNVWILPGVPQIFAMKMPVVESELGGGEALISQAVYCTLDEGNLKPLLDRVVSEHGEVEIGSYPKWNEPRYRTKVTFDAADREAVSRAKSAFEALLGEGELVLLEDEG